jgi:hypothetical protein
MPNADGSKSGGRKKGTGNKVPQLIKGAITEAFTQLGGVDYLVGVARDDPKTFCALLAKLVPAELSAQIEGTMNLTVFSGIDQAPGALAEKKKSK